MESIAMTAPSAPASFEYKSFTWLAIHLAASQHTTTASLNSSNYHKQDTMSLISQTLLYTKHDKHRLQDQRLAGHEITNAAVKYQT